MVAGGPDTSHHDHPRPPGQPCLHRHVHLQVEKPQHLSQVWPLIQKDYLSRIKADKVKNFCQPISYQPNLLLLELLYFHCGINQ